MVRKRNEIFKLHDEFWSYPAAAYHGQLANIPEHVHIKTRDDLIKRTQGLPGSRRVVKAQIVRIDGTKVELRLLE